MPPDPEISPVEIYDYFFFWMVIVAVSIVLIIRDPGTLRHKVLWGFLFAIFPCIGVIAYYYLGPRTRDWGLPPPPVKRRRRTRTTPSTQPSDAADSGEPPASDTEEADPLDPEKPKEPG